MTVFLAAPYSLSEGDLIEVKVIATNDIGDSTESAVNTVGENVQTVPHTPTNAPSRNSATTTSSITVDYAAIAQNGGSTILSYSLEWDQGTDNWVSLIGETVHSTSLQHQINSLTQGDSYKFRYRAYNVHGWSAYSPEATILVATEPSKITTLSVTQSTNDASYVLLTWTKPSENGSTISAYLVEIR